MIASILNIVLPVLLMFVLGMVCKKTGILSEAGLAGIKNIISNIFLPVVLFSAFFNARYNLNILVICICVYFGFGIALGLGILLRKAASPFDRYMPLLVTSAEGGMLGYALYGLLFGNENTFYFATVDLGQTLFAYTGFLTALKAFDGKNISLKESLRVVMTNRPFIGMCLGIFFGATGISGLITGSPAGTIVNTLLSFISAPTSVLILITVGYEFKVSKNLLKPVLLTALIRLAIMFVLYFGMIHLLPLFIDLPINTRFALLLMYTLPAPFIIPLFMENKSQWEYVSATLSVQTVLSLVLFAFIAVVI